jgi:Na+-transporting NADH:ubiquinone oxidoreductase subunit NqrA
LSKNNREKVCSKSSSEKKNFENISFEISEFSSSKKFDVIRNMDSAWALLKPFTSSNRFGNSPYSIFVSAIHNEPCLIKISSSEL